MKIKFADLRSTDHREVAIIREVLQSGIFVCGPKTVRFQETFRKVVGDEGFVVGVASGNAALLASIRSVQFEALYEQLSNKVLLPALSFASTLHAVIEAGLQPVFCDVLPNGLLDQEKAAELIKKEKIPLAIFVHLYGQHEKLVPEFLNACPVIEDAAQTVPITETVQGDAMCFSFYPSKNLGAVGDAGAVVAKEKSFALRVAAYINYGRHQGEHHPTTRYGNNLRISEIQAGILAHRISKLIAYNDKRNLVAQTYLREGVRAITHETKRNVWHLYPILVEDPVEFARRLEDKGVETGRHYPYTLPELFRGWGSGSMYPVASYIAKHVLSLPIGPHMHSGHALRIVGALQEFAFLNDSDHYLLWELKK